MQDAMDKMIKSYKVNSGKKVIYNGKQYNPISRVQLGAIAYKTVTYVNNYNKMIEKANETRPDDQKIPLLDVDKCLQDLAEKAKDPKMVAIYNISSEIEKNVSFQDKILDNLIKTSGTKFEDLTTRNYLQRSLKFLFKTDNSPESQKYNKDLFESYIKNPEAFAYVRYKKMMEFDPQELINCGEDEVKLLEFARDNLAFCYEANEFNDPIIVGDYKVFKASKDYINNVDSFKGMIQRMNYPAGAILSKYTNYYSYLGMPNLTKEQAEAVSKNYGKVLFKVEKDQDGNEKIKKENMPADEKKQISIMKGDPDPRISPAKYFKQLTDKGLVVDKNVFLKYKPVFTDPETGQKKIVSLEWYLDGKANVTLEERTKDEMDRIKYLSDSYAIKYNMEFQKRIGENLGEAYNIFQVIKDNKGGFLENLFGKTSPEYKEFINSLQAFTNPEKGGNGYLNKDVLREKTRAYLEHTQNDRPERNETNATRQGRIRLANAVLNTLDEMDRDSNNIHADIYNQVAGSAIPFANDVKKESIEEQLINEEENNNISFENEELNKTISDISVDNNNIDKNNIDNSDDDISIEDDDDIPKIDDSIDDDCMSMY